MKWTSLRDGKSADDNDDDDDNDEDTDAKDDSAPQSQPSSAVFRGLFGRIGLTTPPAHQSSKHWHF